MNHSGQVTPYSRVTHDSSLAGRMRQDAAGRSRTGRPSGPAAERPRLVYSPHALSNNTRVVSVLQVRAPEPRVSRSSLRQSSARVGYRNMQTYCDAGIAQCSLGAQDMHVTHPVILFLVGAGGVKGSRIDIYVLILVLPPSLSWSYICLIQEPISLGTGPLEDFWNFKSSSESHLSC